VIWRGRRGSARAIDSNATVRLVVSLAAVLLVTVTGCGSSTVDNAGRPVPGATCLPGSTVGAAASTAPAATGQPLPDLTLDCFEGGGSVRLRQLRRPAIVNLWASWCGPCVREMPAFQSYASRVGDRVLILGVDTGDPKDSGASLLQDVKVTYPNLYDKQRLLLGAVGRSALPVTLFVDAGGRIQYLYNSVTLDEAAITRLAQTYLGVAAG
jgi:thiol-disulfide isomerase/thioredoxin